MYVTQSVQNADRNVPIISGRDADLFLFLYGKEQNITSQSLRVQLFHNGNLFKTLRFPAGSVAVDHLSITESVIEIPISGHVIQPGLSILVKTATGESFPQEGTPHPIQVQQTPVFHIRFVPIYVSATGKTGQVNLNNISDYMRDIVNMFPINKYIADIHSTVTVPFNPANDNFYDKVLNYITTIWNDEGRPDYYYYGVLPKAKSVGGNRYLLGVGWVGDPRRHLLRQAVGIDIVNTSFDAAETMAHEVGHNLGRLHAPCGNPSRVDPNYPYPGAGIGVYGYNASTGELKSPAIYKDLMSYCEPVWISDYTYKGIMKFRRIANSIQRIRQSSQEVLMVSGSLEKNHLTLNPAFKMKSPALLPQKTGTYKLSGYDANGQQLFSISFAGSRIADSPSRSFVFAIPVNRVHINKLKTIQLTGRRLKAVNRARTPMAKQHRPAKKVGTRISAQRNGPETVSLRWDNSHYEMMIIKDAKTNEIIGFTKGGPTVLKTDANELKLLLSDGVHTTKMKIPVR